MSVYLWESTCESLPVWVYLRESTCVSLPVRVYLCKSTCVSLPVWVYLCESTCGSPLRKDTGKAAPQISLFLDSPVQSAPVQFLRSVSFLTHLCLTVYFIFHDIPVVRSQVRWRPRAKRQRNHNNLQSAQQSSATPAFSAGLWNCRSPVNKSDFIPTLASQLYPQLLALNGYILPHLRHCRFILPFPPPLVCLVEEVELAL